MKKIFVLMCDGDGTLHSSDTPFGVAVDNEEEAKRFVKEGKVGYTHSYQELTVFSNKDDAIKHVFPFVCN
jgi:hypothetical protein